MFDKFKDFLINKALGRVLVRLVATLAAGLASGAWGVSVELSPEEMASLVTGAAGLVNAAISKLKPREKAPEAAPAPEAPKA